MNDALQVAIPAAAFVGSHLLLSHPLRAPLVRVAGQGGFMALYAVVAAATLGWLATTYAATPVTPPLWPVNGLVWALATLVMLFAAVLLMGSLVRNPAAPGGNVPDGPATGVFAITRHPMMWSIALWAGCHIAVYPLAANIVLAGAIGLLALAGAALQDRKKRRQQPAAWPGWEARTSFWPFAAIAAKRARLRAPGMHALAGGVVVWLAATWAHIPLSGWPAGIWRWLG